MCTWETLKKLLFFFTTQWNKPHLILLPDCVLLSLVTHHWILGFSALLLWRLYIKAKGWWTIKIIIPHNILKGWKCMFCPVLLFCFILYYFWCNCHFPWAMPKSEKAKQHLRAFARHFRNAPKNVRITKLDASVKWALITTAYEVHYTTLWSISLLNTTLLTIIVKNLTTQTQQ